VVDPSSVARLAFRAVAAFAIAACTTAVPRQGDPNAPVVYIARVVDAQDRPLGLAHVTLSVRDPVMRAVVYQETFVAGLDGRLAVHLRPSPALEGAAARNQGVLNFDVEVTTSSGDLVASGSFTRVIFAGGWAPYFDESLIRPVEGGALLGVQPDA
jgi:hypothetical protein